MKWIPGPPPGRGRWWVYWNLRTGPRVECVEVGPALLQRDNPDARLLIKMLGGAAYEFAPNRDDITHHMPLETPVGPGAP